MKSELDNSTFIQEESWGILKFLNPKTSIAWKTLTPIAASVAATLALTWIFGYRIYSKDYDTKQLIEEETWKAKDEKKAIELKNQQRMQEFTSTKNNLLKENERKNQEFTSTKNDLLTKNENKVSNINLKLLKVSASQNLASQLRREYYQIRKVVYSMEMSLKDIENWFINWKPNTIAQSKFFESLSKLVQAPLFTTSFTYHNERSNSKYTDLKELGNQYKIIEDSLNWDWNIDDNILNNLSPIEELDENNQDLINKAKIVTWSIGKILDTVIEINQILDVEHMEELQKLNDEKLKLEKETRELLQKLDDEKLKLEKVTNELLQKLNNEELVLLKDYYEKTVSNIQNIFDKEHELEDELKEYIQINILLLVLIWTLWWIIAISIMIWSQIVFSKWIHKLISTTVWISKWKYNIADEIHSYLKRMDELWIFAKTLLKIAKESENRDNEIKRANEEKEQAKNEFIERLKKLIELLDWLPIWKLKDIILIIDNISRINQQIAQDTNTLVQKFVKDLQQTFEDQATQAKLIDQINESSQRMRQRTLWMIQWWEKAQDISENALEKWQMLLNAMKIINQIVEEIRGISKQTTLLALNATIESARAWEAWKWFKVVADEVKNLSQRTWESTSEISSNVELVNQNVKEVERIIRQISDHIIQSNQSFKDTDQDAQDQASLTSNASEISVRSQEDISKVVNDSNRIKNSSEESHKKAEEISNLIKDALTWLDEISSAINIVKAEIKKQINESDDWENHYHGGIELF